MKNLHPFIVLSLIGIVMMQSCCDTCDLQFENNELNWLPYEDNQQIIFSESMGGETIVFINENTKIQEQDKDCESIRERICYLTATQLLEPNEPDFGSNLSLDITKFKDGALLLSIQFIVSENHHDYIGLTSSSYNLEEDLIPELDSLLVGNLVFYKVYKFVGIDDPLIPDELNSIEEFYYTKNDGLVRFITKDNKTWNITE